MPETTSPEAIVAAAEQIKAEGDCARGHPPGPGYPTKVNKRGGALGATHPI